MIIREEKKGTQIIREIVYSVLKNIAIISQLRDMLNLMLILTIFRIFMSSWLTPFEKQSCLEIAELLRKKYEKPSPSESTTTTTTKNKPSKKSSTGLNCNFPLRFESLRFDLNNFFRKCLKTEVKHMHHENARGYNPRPYLLPVFFDLIKLIYREDFERFNYQEIKFSNFSVDVVPRDKHPAFTSSRHLSLAMSQLNSSSSSSALEKYWLDLATKVKLINSTFMPPSEKNEKKKELVQFLRSNPFSKNRRTEKSLFFKL